MQETMAIKLAPSPWEDPDIVPEEGELQTGPDPDEGIFPWESVFIDPEVDPNITIEGMPIWEIATEVQSSLSKNPVLSYEDILVAFGLSEDDYTPEHHERLLIQALFGAEERLLLMDALPENVGRRHLLNLDDFPPPLVCGISHYGFPATDPAFHLALGNLAVKDAEQASNDSQATLLKYAYGDADPNLEEIFSRENPLAQLTLGLMISLANDIDPDRVKEIEETLVQAGCADVERDKTCTLEGQKIKPKEYEAFMQRPECRFFEQDLQCVHQALSNLMLDMDDKIEETGLTEYRQQAKGNTFTTFGRALYLREAIGLASQTEKDVFKTPPENILIIGPGLEEMHPDFNVSVPRQSYEPFAVAEAAVKYLHVDPDRLHIDLRDISPRVVTHFTNMIDKARKGSPHRFYLSQPADETSRDRPKIDFADDLPGTKTILSEERMEDKGIEGITAKVIEVSPKIVSRLNAAEGDIITDYLAPPASYDWIFIMNTFDYFSDSEKILAMGNIARLLKPGGILFTDLPPDAFSADAFPECGLSDTVSLTTVRTVRSPGLYRPLILYIKAN